MGIPKDVGTHLLMERKVGNSLTAIKDLRKGGSNAPLPQSVNNLSPSPGSQRGIVDRGFFNSCKKAEEKKNKASLVGWNRQRGGVLQADEAPRERGEIKSHQMRRRHGGFIESN